MSENLHFTDEDIVDYLEGIIEPGHKELLERMMEIEEDLKRRVEKMRVAMVAVKQWGLREKVKALTIETREHGEAQREKATEARGREGAQRKIIRYSMAVAA